MAFLKRHGIQIKPEETTDFELLKEEKKILDEQENLTIEEGLDNDLFIVELKREYGVVVGV